MHRFFVDFSLGDKKSFNIKGTDFNHIKNVLRLKAGNEITVCDIDGVDFKCTIDKYYENNIQIIKSIKINSKTEPDIKVTLCQSILKADKMDWTIQKATELGVSRIVPIITERTIIKFKDEKDKDKKVTRWQRIAGESSKQCRRCTIPEVSGVIEFNEALNLTNYNNLSIIPFEKEKTNALKNILSGKKTESVLVFIGPEGGFTDLEITKAEKEGVKPLTLGPRILRSETAALTMISLLMYELGDIS
jgi:16S rRNA (uracil1498-N3)-methyltransferase